MRVIWQGDTKKKIEQIELVDCMGKLQLSTQLFHPLHKVITVVENPADEAGYHLLLQAAKQRYKKLKCSCVTHDSPVLVHALLKQEFICKRHCYEGCVELQDLALDWHLNATNLQTVSQLSGQQREFLTKQLVEDYRETHSMVSPLNPQLSTTTIAQRMLMNADEYHSYVINSHQQYGYFITEQVAGDTVFVSYVGGNASAKQLLIFYATCFVRLHQSGIVRFEYEIDDTNTHQWLLQTFFKISDASYDAYIYEA